MQKYLLIGAKALLTLAFLAAGIAKLMGQEMMVATFETIGVGSWFRYVTAIFEISGAILIWVQGRQFIGAGLLLCTMIGAVLAHLFILGPSAVPAIVLGALAAFVLYTHRDQNPAS